jgi:phosphatidylglycerophosphate synthase
MIDRFLLPVQHRLLIRPARALARRGVPADAVTIGGFLIGALSLPALAFGHYGLALGLILLNRLADGIDGEIARANGPTDRGAFLDIALDFLFYALVPLGFALADPGANALAAAVLLAAFIGTGSSFLAFSAAAARRGLSSAQYPTKGLYYLGGLTEGTETMAAFVAFCLWPDRFPLLAGVFAALCFVTTLGRWLAGWRLLGRDAPPRG